MLTAESWAQEIQVGDILEAKSGLLRVVRYVSRKHGGSPRKLWVAFAIQHCSWTRKPYTYYNVGELFLLGYRPLGLKSNLASEFDFNLLSDIEGRHPDTKQCNFRCCDVIGIP